ncbi:MAG TPA: ABC transporter ATP-binding protein, partial [Candidatus Sulfotelmatobacter sp.]|nr:ABC transporter ATP-binding protein [Candidatus Sulfotelmatobacter sp.]
MSDVAIQCEGLGKQYRIGERERYKALRDVIMDGIKSPFRRLRNGLRSSLDPAESESTIWALKDVSFEVKPGEVIGIIGRNGSGKSTLLKILSRITEPTTGRAEIHGRVGSLLEVGTGFHPELTGRENIFLNGAILGMRKTEVTRKFDEIVAFAEVDKFIDTPVKRYSSGMYVRLAFAVAAHMETEILLVDEVLAVGDAQFQKKCFEKFRQISTGGRTIVFVSHNMAALRTVCENAIVLDHGGVADIGEVNIAVDRYLSRLNSELLRAEAIETHSFVVEEVRINSLGGSIIKTFDDIEIRVRFAAKIDIREPGLYVGIRTLENERIAGLDFRDFQTAASLRVGESVEMGFRVNGIPLLPGDYELELHLKDM